MTADEMIAVIQAWKDGKRIQYRVNHPGREAKWSDVIAVPCWDFANHDYRVKPEPREFWINLYPGASFYSAWESEARARHNAGTGAETVLVREVLK